MSLRVFSANELKMHPSAQPDAFEVFRRDVYPLIDAHVLVAEREAVFLRELLLKKESTLRSSTPAHLTTSSVVLDPQSEAFLMLLHNKIGEWVYPGGHADGSWELLHSSLRECFEETSLPSLEVIPPWFVKDEALGIHCPHFFQKYLIRSNASEPAHVHFDAVYVFRASSRRAQHDPLESSGLRWFSKEELREHSKRQDGSVVSGVDALTARVCLRAMQSALGPGGAQGRLC
jgi:8-oxo-dGTP pyrophosphatase MutT (NUDIX family)